MKSEDYTHRIGRTGRAGRDGLAVTFAEFRDRRKIGDIEHYSQQRFQAETIPGLEPKQRAAPPARTGFGGKPARFGDQRRPGGFGNQRTGFAGKSFEPRGPREGGGGGGGFGGNRDGGFGGSRGDGGFGGRGRPAR
jgi:superfamily II DNA/RNA helicase